MADRDVEKQRSLIESHSTVIEVKRIENASHPLYSQYGLFAKEDIAANTIIGRYTGEVVLDPKNSNYAYWLGSVGDTSYFIDAKVRKTYVCHTSYSLNSSQETRCAS